MVFRLPESDEPPEVSLFLPAADEVEDLVVREPRPDSLFAARFRENAARALLLPRRHPGRRSPLWAQRKRAADLLAVASRYGSFPILLETYRECLRDVFDLPGLVDILRRIASRRIRVVTVDSRTPSPFAASLLFSYVANFIYDGDAPLAERRAQALSVDQAQLRELLGEAELRELLDPERDRELERSLQRLEGRRVRHADALHDLLLSLGDLTEEEIRARSRPPEEVAALARALCASGGSSPSTVAGERASRPRRTRGGSATRSAIVPPPGLPEAFLEPVRRSAGTISCRGTRGPTVRSGSEDARRALRACRSASCAPRWSAWPAGPRDRGRVPSRRRLPRVVRRRGCGRSSAARSRSCAARSSRSSPPRSPFPARMAGRRRAAAPGWRRSSSVVEQLQGCPIPASVLETEILPRESGAIGRRTWTRFCAAGEVVWRGLEPLGPATAGSRSTCRTALALLAPAREPGRGRARGRRSARSSPRAARCSSRISPAETGAFPGDLVDALWDLVWAGEVTNDTLAPLRAAAGVRPSQGRRAGSERRSARGGWARREARGDGPSRRLPRKAPAGDRAPHRARRRRCSSATAS